MPRALGVAKINNRDMTPPVVEIGRPRLRGLIKVVRGSHYGSTRGYSLHDRIRGLTAHTPVQLYILDDTPFRSGFVDRLLLLL